MSWDTAFPTKLHVHQRRHSSQGTAGSQRSKVSSGGQRRLWLAAQADLSLRLAQMLSSKKRCAPAQIDNSLILFMSIAVLYMGRTMRKRFSGICGQRRPRSACAFAHSDCTFCACSEGPYFAWRDPCGIKFIILSCTSTSIRASKI